MEGLGRLFNVSYPADDDYISLVDAAAVTFVVYEVDGATSVTISTATDASGTDVQTDDLVSRYYQSSLDQSNGTWVKVTQTASETFTPSDTTGDLAVVTIHANQLRDTHKYVKATADGSAIVFAITHDLLVQRTPPNLRSLIA